MTATLTRVRERPILFSPDLVCAILDGNKSQTRRFLNAPADVSCLEVGPFHPTIVRRGEEEPGEETFGAFTPDGEWAVRCPFGRPGDRLWVRENWQTLSLDYDYETGYCDGWEEADPESVRRWKQSEQSEWSKPPYCITYQSTGGWDSHRDDRGFRWRPSIHMPRWASQLSLEVTDVRVQRIQDMSVEDAQAEGYGGGSGVPGFSESNPADAYEEFATCSVFADRWNENPWVWVIGFRRIEKGA